MLDYNEITVPSPSKKIFLVLSLLLPRRWQFAEMMLSLMFKPPSILQPDIIMEFSITTSDDILYHHLCLHEDQSK